MKLKQLTVRNDIHFCLLRVFIEAHPTDRSPTIRPKQPKSNDIEVRAHLQAREFFLKWEYITSCSVSQEEVTFAELKALKSSEHI